MADLRDENESLKRTIEQMKIDMEVIVDKVKHTLAENSNNGPGNSEEVTRLETELRTVKRRLQDRESEVDRKQDEVVKLRKERDRLI